MTTKKKIIIIVLVLFGIYLVIGVFAAFRLTAYSPPMRAVDSFLRAIQQRDLTNMYLYSDQLKPHLVGLLMGSNLGEQERQEMMDQDYFRWSKAMREEKQSEDTLYVERKLVNKWAKIDPALPVDYRAEVLLDGDFYLVSYQDAPGDTHHIYFKLSYPSAKRAPRVSLLHNMGNRQSDRIKSVIVRVETRRRPSVGSWHSFLLEQAWLDSASVLYPFLGAVALRDPSKVWMVKLSFDVDKKTLETF